MASGFVVMVVFEVVGGGWVDENREECVFGNGFVTRYLRLSNEKKYERCLDLTPRVASTDGRHRYMTSRLQLLCLNISIKLSKMFDGFNTVYLSV